MPRAQCTSLPQHTLESGTYVLFNCITQHITCRKHGNCRSDMVFIQVRSRGVVDYKLQGKNSYQHQENMRQNTSPMAHRTWYERVVAFNIVQSYKSHHHWQHVYDSLLQRDQHNSSDRGQQDERDNRHQSNKQSINQPIPINTHQYTNKSTNQYSRHPARGPWGAERGLLPRPSQPTPGFGIDSAQGWSG